MDFAVLIAFAGAFFVFAASPGPDNMTIVARTLTHGPWSGLAYGAGMVSGILVYLALAASGLSILAAEMSWVMTLMRYIGGLYLIWMAVSLWTSPPVPPEVAATRSGRDLFQVFLTGIALNLGNPKMPLFYLALLPNFVGTSFSANDVLSLAIVIVAVEIVVVGGHIWFAGKGRRLLQVPAVIRRTNRAAAVFLFGTGVAVLTTQGSR